MGVDPNDATVLVVDDEPMVADSFSLQLERWYAVRTAYGGEEALELADEAVDVVLLDRRMPDRSGDEVLRELRERDLDVQVVMITAVDADFDVLSMPCDGYVEKPVGGEALREAVEKQLALRRYDERVSEFFATADKLAALETEKSARALESNEKYRELKERHGTLNEELEELFRTVDDDALLLREREPGVGG
jgi:DNA-binding response OmpR family regulator